MVQYIYCKTCRFKREYIARTLTDQLTAYEIGRTHCEDTGHKVYFTLNEREFLIHTEDDRMVQGELLGGDKHGGSN